jgi:erythromycin esterase
MNRQVGVDLDAYANGSGGDLPAIVRSPSFFRTWRTDEFAGLILWLRAYNLQASHPVHVVGVDCQDAGVDAEVALQFVAARDAAAAIRLRAAFKGLLGVPNPPRFAVWATSATIRPPDYTAALQASRELAALFTNHQRDWSSSAGYAEAAYAARVAWQAMDAFEFESGRGDPYADGWAYYGRRDRYMAANMLERLNGHTGVFWAHDLHIIGDVPASDHWPTGMTWVGRELRQTLGARYQTVTFAWSEGSFRSQTLDDDTDEGVSHRKPMVPQTLVNNAPEDLGGVLEKVGPERFWADLRLLPQEPWATRVSSTAYPRGWAGWGVEASKWNKDEGSSASLRPGTDVLVWFRRITPSHLLPGDDF